MSLFIRKTLILGLSLVLAIITATVTTYAWLSLSTTAVVDQLSLTVVSGRGILIRNDSVIPSNWTTEINNAEEVMEKNDFDAVTSKDGVNFYKANQYGIYPYIGNVDAAPNTVPNYDYFEIMISIKNGSRSLDQETIKCNFNISSSVSEYRLLNKTYDYIGNMFYAGQVINVDIMNALRYSVSVGRTSLGSEEAKATTIYEPYNDYNMGSYGLQQFIKNGVFVIPLYNSGMEYFHSISSSRKYHEAWLEATNNQFQRIVLMNSGAQDTIKEVPDETGTLPPIDLVKLIGQEEVQVTFRFWFEGLDADCFNSILAKKISLGLNFTIQ